MEFATRCGTREQPQGICDVHRGPRPDTAPELTACPRPRNERPTHPQAVREHSLRSPRLTLVRAPDIDDRKRPDTTPAFHEALRPPKPAV
jgi:hypothetical protein